MIETIDRICQIWMFYFGLSAITLVSFKIRLGFIFGLLSQPSFFITAWIHDQPGLFWLSVPYSISWIIGIWKWYFVSDKTEKDTRCEEGKIRRMGYNPPPPWLIKKLPRPRYAIKPECKHSWSIWKEDGIGGYMYEDDRFENLVCKFRCEKRECYKCGRIECRIKNPDPKREQETQNYEFKQVEKFNEGEHNA